MNTRNLILVCLFNVSFTALAFSQSTQTRNVGDFHSISVQSGIDLYLTQSSSQSVEVTANDDFIDRVITEIEGGSLKIYLKKKDGKGWKGNWNTGRLEVRVSTDELRSLSASGGSDVENKGTWESDEMKINASGGSDIELDIDVQTLNVNTSGGSDLNVTGTADILKLNCSGGSDFKGKSLMVKEAKVNSSGGSDAYINVSEKLVATASGSSDIHYTGNPQIKDLNSSSSADIRKY